MGRGDEDTQVWSSQDFNKAAELQRVKEIRNRITARSVAISNAPDENKPELTQGQEATISEIADEIQALSHIVLERLP